MFQPPPPVNGSAPGSDPDADANQRDASGVEWFSVDATVRQLTSHGFRPFAARVTGRDSLEDDIRRRTGRLAAGWVDRPYVCQHERTLLLLDEELLGWVVARLRFDERRCRYLEVGRATFRSPREAAGALLSRLIGTNDDTLARAADDLRTWIAARHGAIVRD